jgi:hypothetical protein
MYRYSGTAVQRYSCSRGAAVADAVGWRRRPPPAQRSWGSAAVPAVPMRRGRCALSCAALLLASLVLIHHLMEHPSPSPCPVLATQVRLSTARVGEAEAYGARENGSSARPGAEHMGSSLCTSSGLFEAQDIVGNDLEDGIAPSARECCRRCVRHVGRHCAGWTFVPGAHGGPRCYLKTAASPRQKRIGLTSGSTTTCCAAVDGKDLLAPVAGPAPAAAGPLPKVAPHVCAMNTWWASVRLTGKVVEEDFAATTEHCCTTCARLGSACAGWMYSTEDKFCRALGSIDSRMPCNVCVSGFSLSSASSDATERVASAGATSAAHMYARQVLVAAVDKGRALSVAQGVPNDPMASSRDIVIVSGWRRPAFLLRTLVKLFEAAGSEQHFYLVILDLHASRATVDVAEAIPFAHHIMRVQPHFFINSGWGNSYAVLEGFRYARALAGQLHSKLVYLVEEDVFVAADFFQFHRFVHLGDGGLRGSSASGTGPHVSLCANYRQRVCVNTTRVLDRRRIFVVLGFNKEITGDGADALLEPCRRFSDTLTSNTSASAQDAALASMVYAKPVYASIGLSIGLAALNAIVQFATPAYYEDPISFIRNRFYHAVDNSSEPTSIRDNNWTIANIGQHLGAGHKVDIGALYGAPNTHTEQDGLINRLIIELGALAIMPRCPRAFHGGFIGYNRESGASNDLKGTTLQSRYEELALLSAAEMAARTSVPDVVATPLAGYFTPSLNYCVNGERMTITDHTVARDAHWMMSREAAHMRDASSTVECGLPE